MIHEPAFTEAPEDDEVPTSDPTTSEHIDREDNVVDDEVLPDRVPNGIIACSQEQRTHQYWSSFDANL